MKILIACLGILLFYQSCKTKQEQSKELKLLFENCDELNIVFYAKDTFVFKTTDTSTIKKFTDLISKSNDDLTETCQATEKLIYKNNGQQMFTACKFL